MQHAEGGGWNCTETYSLGTVGHQAIETNDISLILPCQRSFVAGIVGFYSQMQHHVELLGFHMQHLGSTCSSQAVGLQHSAQVTCNLACRNMQVRLCSLQDLQGICQHLCGQHRFRAAIINTGVNRVDPCLVFSPFSFCMIALLIVCRQPGDVHLAPWVLVIAQVCQVF